MSAEACFAIFLGTIITMVGILAIYHANDDLD